MVIVESSFFEGFMSSFSAVAMRHTCRSDTGLGRKRYSHLSLTSEVLKHPRLYDASGVGNISPSKLNARSKYC
jgi:hypothetical protein